MTDTNIVHTHTETHLIVHLSWTGTERVRLTDHENPGWERIKRN